MTLSRGTVFAGDFQILDDKPLSEGGMGVVYLVEQVSTGKRRALKLMHAPLVADKKLRDRFIQEARVGGRIESAHVVDVVSAGIDDATGVPWLAMELLDGKDLGRRIEEGGPVDRAEALQIFEQLCHAVGSAHAASIVHRDLKPENIFLARSKEASGRSVVKVLDFGIAKIVAEAATKRTGGMGTPLWMAPEQTDTGVVTGTADIWALGLIAFYVLTGRCFWKTGNKEEVSVQQIMREVLFSPIPLASVRAMELGSTSAGTLPAGFDEWFARCVDRDPEARFATATLAFDALARALHPSPSRISEPPSTEPSGATLAAAAEAPRPVQPRIVTPTVEMVRPAAPAFPPPAPPAAPPAAPRVIHPDELDNTVLAPPVAPPPRPSAANPPTPPPNVMPARPATRSSLLYVLSVVAIVLTAGVAIAFFRPREAPRIVTSSPAPEASSPVIAPIVPLSAAPPKETVLPRIEAPRTQPVVPASDRCFVSIFSTPRAKILLDEKAVGFTPLLKHEVKPGAHVVKLVLDDGLVKPMSFTIAPGQTKQVLGGDLRAPPNRE